MEALIVCPEMAGADVIQLLRREAPATVTVFALSPEAFASLSARDGPAGVAAVLELRVGDLASFSPEPQDILVALWRVENPGNLGTVVRTADSFGVQAVILVDRCTNPYAPAAAKASMGALFHTPLVACGSLAELRAWCGRHGASLVGTSAHGSIASTAWAPRRPTVLLFGREGGGLTAEGVALCDYTVRIPLQGVNTSLNLATAAGILTYIVAGGSSRQARAPREPVRSPLAG